MTRRFWGNVAAFWGITGIMANLVMAIFRVSPQIPPAFQFDLAWYHWAIMLLFSAQMLYAEAYKGFHLKFCPRVTARMQHLRNHPNWKDALLAPIFCIGYYNASKRTKIVAYGIFVFVFVVVRLMRFVPQPWRGLLDVGVVIGLGGGLLSLIYYTFWAFSKRHFPFEADVQRIEK